MLRFHQPELYSGKSPSWFTACSHSHKEKKEKEKKYSHTKSINFLITHPTESPVHFNYDSGSYSITDITAEMLSFKQKEGLLDKQRPRMEREVVCLRKAMAFLLKALHFPRSLLALMDGYCYGRPLFSS